MDRRLYDTCCRNDERRVHIILSSFGTPEGIRLCNAFRDELALQQPILTAVCAWDNDRLVEALWRAGMDLQVSNAYGDTPLHFAVLFGKLNAARKLVALGANVNARNSRMATPLHYATVSAVIPGQHGALDLLVGKGARILTDDDGLTPLDLAVIGGKGVLIDKLLSWQDLTQVQGGWQTLSRLLLRPYPQDGDKDLLLAVKLLHHVRQSKAASEMLSVVLVRSNHLLDVAFNNISRVLTSPFYPLSDGVHSRGIARVILSSVEAVKVALKDIIKG